jgi:ABC-type spermidine/putrescine transport system permease subunit II
MVPAVRRFHQGLKMSNSFSSHRQRRAAQANRWQRWLLVGYVGVIFALLYLPILLLAYLSFNDTQTMSVEFMGLTLRWYAAVASQPGLINSIGNSLMIGLLASVIAAGMAVSLALAMRLNVPFKRAISQLVLVPILIPGVVSGVVLLMFFGYAGVAPNLWMTVLPTHITWVLPFAFLTIFPKVAALDPSIEEAAMDLGAAWPMVYRRIIFPIIRPAVIATILFGFTLSFDEFIRTFFIVGRDRTVPVYLWELLSDQMAPFLPAVGVVVTVISVATSLIGFLASAWAGKSAGPELKQAKASTEDEITYAK